VGNLPVRLWEFGPKSAVGVNCSMALLFYCPLTNLLLYWLAHRLTLSLLTSLRTSFPCSHIYNTCWRPKPGHQEHASSYPFPTTESQEDLRTHASSLIRFHEALTRNYPKLQTTASTLIQLCEAVRRRCSKLRKNASILIQFCMALHKSFSRLRTNASIWVAQKVYL
jgi:hypothetical protein